jgi:hypothetical protein
MTFGHVMGIPVEESALALAPAGAAIVTGLAVVARSTTGRIAGWLRHPNDQDHVAFGEPGRCTERRHAAESAARKHT